MWAYLFVLVAVATAACTDLFHPIWKRLWLALTPIDALPGEVILLTGAAGGVGSALVPRLCALTPSALLLVDFNPAAISLLVSTVARDNIRDVFVYDRDFNLVQHLKAGVSGTSRDIHTPCLIFEADITQIGLLGRISTAFSHIITSPNALSVFPGSVIPATSAPTILINNAGIVRPIALNQIANASQKPTPGSYTAASVASALQSTFFVNTFAPIQLIYDMIQLHSPPFSVSESVAEQPSQGMTVYQPQQRQLQILSVSSSAGTSYSTGLGPYCGSKAALSQILRAMRLEHLRSSSPHSSGSVADLLQTCALAALPLPVRSVCRRAQSASTREFPHIQWYSMFPWHISTPMFNAITTSALIDYLMPSLTPDAVAEAMSTQIQLNSMLSRRFGPHSSYLEHVCPWILTIAPIFQLLPLWLSDLCAGIGGGWSAMDTYQVAAPVDPRLVNLVKRD